VQLVWELILAGLCDAGAGSLRSLVTEGLSNPDIANRLFISRATVKTHLAHVFAKLNVINRARPVALATCFQSWVRAPTSPPWPSRPPPHAAC
jgi:hypothetical protein